MPPLVPHSQEIEPNETCAAALCVSGDMNNSAHERRMNILFRTTLTLMCFVSAVSGQTSNSPSPFDSLLGVSIGTNLPSDILIVKPLFGHSLTVAPPIKTTIFPQCRVRLNTNDQLVASIQADYATGSIEEATNVFNNASSTLA